MRGGASGAGKGLLCAFPAPSAGILNPYSMVGTIPTGIIYHSKLWEWWPERGMLWGLRLPAASWQMGRGSSSETSFHQLGWRAQWGRVVFSALQCPLAEG